LLRAAVYNRRVHICFACNEYPPAPHGGIGSFTQTLARALVKSGQAVTVLGAYPDEYAGQAEDEGVRVVRISRRGPPVARFWLNRRKVARALARIDGQKKIDVLEGGELELCMLSRQSPGTKVLRMHGGPRFFAGAAPPPRIKLLKEWWAFRVADHLCAVSHCVAEGTRRLMKLGPRPIEVIPNPIDVEFFAPDPEKEERGLIVFTGTVTERKGIRELIQAMPRILAEVPEARLEVYGGDDIFPVGGRSLTRELAESLPAPQAARIEWKGRVSRGELPLALQRASVCVYPSHMEAMPIAWLEGLACGKAVVAAQAGPGPEVIDDGVTGLLCDSHDPGSIAGKIVSLLRNEPLRRALGGAARRAAVERYSLNSLVKRNLEYYERIAGRPRA
jgi:glycosyltransferase involved in cell wall biosynthesis